MAGLGSELLFIAVESNAATLLRFMLTNAPVVKVIGNPISDGIVFKNELTRSPLLEV